MIINLGCASVDNHIPRDDIFDYHPRRECNIYIICYFDKFDRNGMYSSTTTTTTTKKRFTSLLCFSFNFGQIKMIFCGDGNFKIDLLRM